MFTTGSLVNTKEKPKKKLNTKISGRFVNLKTYFGFSFCKTQSDTDFNFT